MISERTDTRFHWSLAVGRVTLTYDGRPVQQAQVQFSGDRLVEPVSLMQHFGFASRPPVGSKVVGLFLQGDPVNGVAVGSNHVASRPTDLQEGDVKLFDVRGAYVWLSADGLQVEAKDMPVVIRDATTVTVIASEKVRLQTPRLEVTGDIVDQCDGNSVTLKQLRDDYNAHGHIAVQPGSGVSGTTNKPAQ